MASVMPNLRLFSQPLSVIHCVIVCCSVVATKVRTAVAELSRSHALTGVQPAIASLTPTERPIATACYYAGRVYSGKRNVTV